MEATSVGVGRATTISYAARCSAGSVLARFGEARLGGGQDDGGFGQREREKPARPEPRSAMATRFVDGFAGRNGGKGCEGRDLCTVTARERMMSSLKCGFGNAELVSRGMTTECSFFRRCFQAFLPSYFIIINFFRACAIHPKGVQSSVRPLEGQPFDLRGDSVRYPSLSVFPLFIEKRIL
ncbi:hypothetical protein BHE74_00032458 [Ensete ventricosum]|nr:hypothetical protein BHE74_00032458 [Ensete ventricosum]